MRSTRLTLITAIVMIAAAAGCSNDARPAGETAKAAEAGTTRSPAATTTASGGPAVDASAKTVCAGVSGEIQTTLAKVTEAEAIGPPAGHYAVSAQFSAGAAGINAHTIGADGQVSKAAKAVAEAMSAIADKYVDASSKPDKAPLTTAIDNFKAACAGK
jgi:hypothetical protein